MIVKSPFSLYPWERVKSTGRSTVEGLGKKLTGKIKMVYDRLRGIERENLPLSRQQAVNDQETVAQQNVLSSINGKTPKEHQIGE